MVLSTTSTSSDDSPDELWSLVNEVPVARAGVPANIQPTAFAAATLNAGLLQSMLKGAPLEFSAEAASRPLEISLPMPDRSFARFLVQQSPIMEPALAAKFPEITTYSGQGIDDRAATLRFDVTPAGFHAQILSPSGALYIEPSRELNDSVYISYFKRDLAAPPDRVFQESLPEEFSDSVREDSHAGDLAGDPAGPQHSATAFTTPAAIALAQSGTQLRTYRLALAATGEYTVHHGGTVAGAMAAIVTTINRVSGIYEVELAVRLVLVANNNLLVYTNSATDPYTGGGDGFARLAQNQTNIDNVIGNANYDIGHVFSNGFGGVAGQAVVGVNASKARGTSGLNAPEGDAFDVDFVAHVMGHQFGANHTFNGTAGSCTGVSRNAATAYEPGSGSTIMAHAGICNPQNLQPNSDPYFHSVSFEEIVAYTTTGVGNAAAAITNTGNNIPQVSAGADFVIPRGTPFVLTAAGSDADASDVLTYNWEERDLGPAQAVFTDNGSSPLFRSFLPTTNPARILPRLSNLLNNTTSNGETLPTTNRVLNFRATVRDNRSGGGGVNSDDMRVTVVAAADPFGSLRPIRP